MENLKRKRAFLYGRVSTTEQKDNGYSLPQQKRFLYDYCQRNDIEVLQYFEEDYTSTTFDRPEYNRMQSELKVNKPDFILFCKWDRFSREPDGIQEVERLLRLQVEPNSISEWVNFKDPTYYLYLAIHIIQGKVENKRRSERTKTGIIGAKKEGRHINKAPIGYVNARDPYNSNKPLIKPCPEKGVLVKKIFEEYATGNYSQESLRQKYYNKGINISKSQFSKLLENLLYLGKIVVPASENSPEEVVNGLHEALIDEVTFRKVQKVKNRKANIRVDTKKSNKHEENLPLRGGILSCCRCGSNLTGSPSTGGSGKRKFYYHCNTKKGCGERFSASLAHLELEKVLSSIKPSKAVVELFKVILEQEYKKHYRDVEQEQKKLELKQREIEGKLDALTEKFVEGDIDKSAYQRMKQKYNGEITNIVLQISEQSELFKDVEKFIDYGLFLLTDLDVIYKNSSTEIKRKILCSIFEGKLIFENKKYRTIKYNEAVNLIVSKNKGLAENYKKEGDSFSRISYSVAGTGLEPVTFGL
ncbi:MAG: recombinase family protein [Flavobacteriaceae bacterium]|nr:recombinase family protein [Flavobacteriaceae bacterium]